MGLEKQTLSDKVKMTTRFTNGFEEPESFIVLKDDVKQHIQEFIKDLKNEIYEDDLIGWHNKQTLKHYSSIIDQKAQEHFGKIILEGKR